MTKQIPNATPKEYFEQAKQLIEKGDLWGAMARAGTLRSHMPEEAPILALNGFLLSRIGAHMPAITDMQRALKITERALDEGDPENPARPRIVDQQIRLKTQIACSYAALGEPQDALGMIDDALEIDPDRADAVSARARVLAMLGKRDEALACLDEAIERRLEPAELWTEMASILGTIENPDAERVERCIDHLDELSAQVGIPAADLMMMLRALAVVCDRAGRYEEAFRAARRAAKLRNTPFNAENAAKAAQALIQNWTVEEIERLVRPEGDPGANRIVLCGSAHSGAPQMEKILGALPDALSLGPAELIGSLANGLFQCSRTPIRPVVPSPKGIRGDQLAKFAQGYCVQSDRIAGTPGLITIDTHPHNTPLLGVAGAALRGLTVINCRRDPVEETLAIFCDEMPGNHAYSGDLVTAASFVRDSMRLMDHWGTVLGDERIGVRVIDVPYTKIMDEPGAVLAQIADVMGVEVPMGAAESLAPAPRIGIADHADEYARHLKQVHEFFGSVGQG